MNTDRFQSRHGTLPDAHIRVLKRSGDQAEDWRGKNWQHGNRSAEASVKRTSLTQEIKDGTVVHTTPLKDPDSIANMEKGVYDSFFVPTVAAPDIGKANCGHGCSRTVRRQDTRRNVADYKMHKGTTFAARARAAELNSARAAAAAKEAMASGGEELRTEATLTPAKYLAYNPSRHMICIHTAYQISYAEWILTLEVLIDEVPELAPVSLGSLKFTRRNSQKASRGSRSQDRHVDLPTNPPTPPPGLKLSHLLQPSTSKYKPDDIVHEVQRSSTTPPLSGRGGKPSQPSPRDRHTYELNQQAIRQKVREVSAKQQSINDNNQDEAYRQGFQSSNSSSPFSSQGSKANQASNGQESDLNIQCIQEIQNQSEKERERTDTPLYEPHLLSRAGVHADNWPEVRTLSTSHIRLAEYRSTEQTSGDPKDLSSAHNTSDPTFSCLDPSQFRAEACHNADQLRRPINNQSIPPTTDETLIHNARTLNIERSLPINLIETTEGVSKLTGLPDQPVLVGNTHTPPHANHDSTYHERFQPSSGNLTLADNPHLNTHVPSPRAASSSPMPQNAAEMEGQTRVARHSELDMPLQLPSDTQSIKQQQYPSYYTNHSQPRRIENQSPHAQQSQSRNIQQMHSEYGQTQSRSSLEQSHSQSIYGQSRPKAMDRFADLKQNLGSSSTTQYWDRKNDDPFTDTAHSSSTVTPAAHSYAVSAHLRGASPAFIPSAADPSFKPHPSNLELVPRSVAKAPLPAVKGTGHDQRFKQQFPRQSIPSIDRHQDGGRFNAPGSLTTDFAEIQNNSHSKQEESFHKALENKENSHHSQSSTTVTGKPPNLRDPMPYTGFSASASKKEQLLGSLNRTIDEAKAKGDLSASNRSVLFDPVASGARMGNGYGASSTIQASDFPTASGSVDPIFKPEALMFDYHTNSKGATPDYNTNLLKDSDPLPPSVRQQQIENKPLSSPDDGHGFRAHRHGYSTVAPHYPPGLSQGTNPFPEASVSNHDGFWDDSLAINSGNPMIEEHMHALSHKSTTHIEPMMCTSDINRNAWVEEQKRLLRPVEPPTGEQLDEVARAWLVSAEDTMVKSVKNVLLQSENLAPLPPGTRYWQQSPETQKPWQTGRVLTASGLRHAPIGSERAPTYTSSRMANAVDFDITNNPRSSSANGLTASVRSNEEIRKRAAVDLVAPLIANLSSYRAGEDPSPLQRYSQPPAWCIDNSEAGRRSFFNDNWGDVPKRVGRDPRYQQTMHEGRSTYFEDPSPNFRRERESLSTYKPTPGWGMIRK